MLNSWLRVEIKNKYYTKLRPAKENQNKPGSTSRLNCISPTLFFLFFTYSSVIKCLSAKNKNKASAKILNGSAMVFIWFLFGLRPWWCCIFILSFLKFYVMYHLFCYTASCQVWVCAANGWHIYVSHGVVIGRNRYPPPGSKRWLAMLP